MSSAGAGVSRQWRHLARPYLEGSGYRPNAEGLVARGWNALRARLVTPSAALNRRAFVAAVSAQAGATLDIPSLRRQFAGEDRELAAASLCADCLEFLEIPETIRPELALVTWQVLNGRFCGGDMHTAAALLVAALCHAAAGRHVVLVCADEEQQGMLAKRWQPALERYHAVCLRGGGRQLRLVTAAQLAQEHLHQRLNREPELHPWLRPLLPAAASASEPDVLLVYDAGQVLLDQALYPVTVLEEAEEQQKVRERVSTWTLFAGEQLMGGIYAGAELAGREISKRYRVRCRHGSLHLPTESDRWEEGAEALLDALASALAEPGLVWLPLVAEPWQQELARGLGERAGARVVHADKYHGLILQSGSEAPEAWPLHIAGLPPEPRLLPQLLSQHWMPPVSRVIRWLDVDLMRDAVESTGEHLQLALMLRCPAGLRHSMLKRLERRLGRQASFMRHRAIHQENQLSRTLAFSQHLRH